MRCRKQIIADLDVTYIIDFLIANNVVDNQAQEAINSMVSRILIPIRKIHYDVNRKWNRM